MKIQFCWTSDLDATTAKKVLPILRKTAEWNELKFWASSVSKISRGRTEERITVIVDGSRRSLAKAANIQSTIANVTVCRVMMKIEGKLLLHFIAVQQAKLKGLERELATISRTISYVR